MNQAPRRVITGVDPQGRSYVVSDDPAVATPISDSMGITAIWGGAMGPIDNSAPVGGAAAPFSIEQMAEQRFMMMIANYAPGLGAEDPGMHFTNTADHFYVIEGEVVLVLDTGDVVMRAGDIGIVRGVRHGWRNDSDKAARLLTFVLPATTVYPGEQPGP